jgi:hypothetical protein
MDFEEVIRDHNDELIKIFNNASEIQADQPLTSLSTLAEQVDNLNKSTEKKMAQLFDKAFQSATGIEG